MGAEPTTPSGWHERMYRSFAAVFTRMGRGHPLEIGGVLASLSPRTPGRSVFNSVIYERPEALAGAVDRLASEYAAAGVRAWTVWVPQSDRASAELLERAGHTLDATPAAMVLDLASMPDPDPGDLDWDSDLTVEELARVNDLAYGYAEGTFLAGLGALDEEFMHLYRARHEGEAVSVLATVDVDGDCSVYWVATLPEARGRRLTSRLMHLALAEGRDRGCDISTLQATKLGQPVYERLGYGDIGTLEMWERRAG